MHGGARRCRAVQGGAGRSPLPLARNIHNTHAETCNVGSVKHHDAADCCGHRKRRLGRTTADASALTDVSLRLPNREETRDKTNELTNETTAQNLNGKALAAVTKQQSWSRRPDVNVDARAPGASRVADAPASLRRRRASSAALSSVERDA